MDELQDDEQEEGEQEEEEQEEVEEQEEEEDQADDVIMETAPEDMPRIQLPLFTTPVMVVDCIKETQFDDIAAAFDPLP